MQLIKNFENIFKALEERNFNVLDAEFADGTKVFKDIYTEYNGGKVVIMYGDNASGKSLFSQIFEVTFRGKKAEKKMPVRAACMRNRTASGMEKAMIFGDEGEQSTGATSVSVAQKCINTTLNEKDGALAILDEPDVGLSDRFQAAFGQWIAQEASKFDTQGLLIISHSKILISSFLEHYKEPVNYVGVCTVQNYSQWASNQTPASIKELLNLSEYGYRKWRAINKILRD